MTTKLAHRIAAMIPIARQLLADGIDPHRCEFDDAIREKEPTGLTDEQVRQVMRWCNAYYELGIAVGLLIDPAVYVKEPRRRGGAR